MYLIKLRFESNIKGVYTYEEETAQDLYWKNKKVIRMLLRWCKNFNINHGFNENYLDSICADYFCGSTINDICNLIVLHIYNLNKDIKEEEQKRKFTLDVIETTEIINTSITRII
jgi:hypothetical protein